MRKYLWDFFGPRALGTAEHFQIHLNQFLANARVEDCVTGLESAREGHHAVYCECPPAHYEWLEKALRPRRILERTPTESEGADAGGADLLH